MRKALRLAAAILAVSTPPTLAQQKASQLVNLRHLIGIHDNTSANRRIRIRMMWAGFGERGVDDMAQHRLFRRRRVPPARRGAQGPANLDQQRAAEPALTTSPLLLKRVNLVRACLP